MKIRTALLPAVVALFATSAVHSATFEIDFSVNGTMGILGTFQAPTLGGAVSDFEVTLSGVIFDTQINGGAFEYDPVTNDFTNFAGFPGFTNSMAAASCGIGACFLELYPIGDGSPGDYLAVDAALANIDDGTRYLINPAPIPLPAGAALLLTALAGLGAARLRRS